MKKAFKIIGKVVLGLLILLAVFLIVMTIYNQIMLRKNKDLYGTPLGQLVEVDGHNMSIYTEGEGEHTIVFMSGWGTTSPILDFKCLYSCLSDENKIAVVEKFGYGFSDVVDGERDFDTILRQDREALQKADIKAPYILCAHSYSGYEAVLWAQKYPDEVEAIVGLDMCIPNGKEEDTIQTNAKLVGLVKLINRVSRYTGLVRIGSSEYSGTLTGEEEKIYTEINAHILANDMMINEMNPDYELDVIDELNSSTMPTVPVLMYVSGDTARQELWLSGTQAMVDASSDGKLIKLDCGHYVHHFESERISRDMKNLIESLNG